MINHLSNCNYFGLGSHLAIDIFTGRVVIARTGAEKFSRRLFSNILFRDVENVDMYIHGKLHMRWGVLMTFICLPSLMLDLAL